MYRGYEKIARWANKAIDKFDFFTDYLSINVNIEQNNHLIKDWKINTGVVKLKAHIHDPSGFFEGSVTRYEWIFNDGSSAKVTTLNEIEHVFEAEGLFLIQVSASIKKNGKLYNGKTSVNCNVKGIDFFNVYCLLSNASLSM